MDLITWQQSGKTFPYNNYQIFYQDAGQGDVLLCIHGFPTSSWDWHCLWPNLTSKFRAIAPDMIGFGFSDKPYHYHYSIHDQATLLQNLLHSIAVKSIHILAHDYGVSVAQELLARYEHRKKLQTDTIDTIGEIDKMDTINSINEIDGIEIKSICFLNGGLFPETHRPRFIQKLLLSPIGFLLTYLTNQKSFNRSFAAIFGTDSKPSDKELNDFWFIVNHKNGLKISHKIIHYITERKHFRSRWVGVLQQTNVPLRLIIGALDPVSGEHMAVRYKDLIPNPDIILLPTIGHYPQVEDPDSVWLAFLFFSQHF